MPDAPDDPVELYRARGPAEAHALRILLEDSGILAHVDNEMLQGVVGEVPGGWVTAPTVLVTRENLERARAILNDFLDRADTSSKDPASSDLCLACRAPMGSASMCPACGWSYELPEEAEA